ncbi:MAG: sigma-70 family RNA polymerase sigma factor, partial [Actinobacteria bacterium]|nr:sigma-70 family RNA polymerase sigma factor [Actinomycetota bacterium]
MRLASDERLVEQLRAGSATAFEEIYDRHHRGILAFCRHMLGSHQEAEDVVQHTFIAAHRSLLADERQIALKAWLYAVARNRCLSLLRVRREHADIDDEATVVPATAGLSAEVEGREDLRALLADLQRLPEDQRAALLLAELEAHSHQEIAVILDVNTAKVKALVFQARATLISRRQARNADCGLIREQLAVLRGGALSRGQLRQHVEQCEGCHAFAADVRRQRAALAVLLPVVPSLALKHSTLTAAAAASGTGAGGGGALVTGGTATSGTAAGSAAGGSAAAGGTAAGSAAGGSAAAGASAAGVTAATASGGSAALTGGGLLGANFIAAKAAIALAVTAVAGGGYAAVKQLPNDRSPATPSRTTSAAPKQTQKTAESTPRGGSVTSTDTCPKQPSAAPGACSDPAPTKADRDADGISNRPDDCALQAANTPSGCRKGAPDPLSIGTVPPTDRLPTDRSPKGTVPPSGRLPTDRLPTGPLPPSGRLPSDRLPKGTVPPSGRLPSDRSPKGTVPPSGRLPTDRLPKGSAPPSGRLPTDRLPTGPL